MFKRLSIIIFFALLLIKPANATYITTAESISWNGAYTSVAEGFESMLYNPAGLYMSSSKYGLNLFGSYGFRYYNNSISTDHILKIINKGINKENATSLFQSIIGGIPDTGFETGFDLSMLNIMTYFKFADFSLGLSIIPKTSFSFTLDKKFFSSIFDTLDFTDGFNFDVSSTFLQYIDFNLNLSTRAKFIEKHIPVEAIYVGMSTHFYLPTFFMKLKLDDSSLNSFTWDNVYGLYGYRMNLKGDMTLSINRGITEALLSTGLINEIGGFNLRSLLSNSGSIGFGLGFDFGFIIQFNKYIRLGFSATDVGFMLFPQSSKLSMNITTDLTIDPSSSNYFQNMSGVVDNIVGGFNENIATGGNAIENESWMPNTAFRIGIAATPLRNKFLDIILAMDISLSGINKALIGQYPVFNFSTGFELTPKFFWVEIPIRMAFNYNTEANNPTFSMGLGLYLGPVQMEIGIKGLEALFEELGAKEFCVGLDFKLEF